MDATTLVREFERAADDDSSTPLSVGRLLEDLTTRTETAVSAVETLQGEVGDRIAKLDALWSDLDGDSVADLDDEEARRAAAFMREHDLDDAADFSEEVTYLLGLVREQSAMVRSASEDLSEGVPPQQVAQRVVTFARESDGADDEFPGELAIRYRDAVLAEE